MSRSLESEVRAVRLAAERAALVRLNAGYGFAAARPLVETYYRAADLRERVGRDLLRPADTHIDQLAAVEEALARLPAGDGPLGELCSRLGLSLLERDVLSAVLACSIDADCRAIFSALGHPSRWSLTVSALQEVFPESCGRALDVAAALHSRGELLATRAISLVGGAGLEAAIELGPDVLAALSGDARVPTRFAKLLEPAATGVGGFLPEAQAARIAEIAALVGATDQPSVVLISGAQGSGKRVIANALAVALGRELIAFNAAAVTDEAELTSALAFARLHGRLAYVAGIEATEDGMVARAIDQHQDVALLATRDSGISSLRLTRPAHLLTATRPTLAVRTAAWKAGLAATGLVDVGEAEALAARYVIGAGAISDVLGDARRHADAIAEPMSVSHLEDAISRRLSLNLGVLGQRITRRASFEEMVLPEDVLDTLRDLIAMVNGRSQILESWGYERHLGLSRGVSALFSGGPGTGKTMAASVVSSELGLELFRIDLSSVVSKWVGETEKNLARIFDEAQDAHAMLLFDEADSLFGKRTDVQSASDRYANLEVNYVLQRMEQFDGISVLTTNLEAGIDPAFMRRLNFRVRFPDPEAEERAELWRKLLPPESGLREIDVGDLAERFEMTGGHIRNAIVRAAVVASREGREMVVEDLVRGAHHEYYELGKVMHSSL